jgi:hypothetical protein
MLAPASVGVLQTTGSRADARRRRADWDEQLPLLYKLHDLRDPRLRNNSELVPVHGVD